MFRTGLFVLASVAAIGILVAYMQGNPGAAYATWARYEKAVASRDGSTAANLLSNDVVGAFERQRRLALSADAQELLRQPMITVLGVLKLRAAVFEGAISRRDLIGSSNPRDFIAKIFATAPPWNTSRFAPVFVLPLGSSESLAWMSLREYFGVESLLLAISSGLRFNFVREDGSWRIDLTPLLQFPANEYDYYSGGTADGRRQFLNNMYANNDDARQQALWTPIADL